MSLDGQFRQLIIAEPQKKTPPVVAPKPKVQNSSPKPFRPGGSTYRQFQRNEDFPPPPPQTSYGEDQSFPPPPPETGRGFGYQEDDFPPPPQSTGYEGRDVTGPIHITTEYNQNPYNTQLYGGSPSAGGNQTTQRAEFRTNSPIGNTYQLEEHQRQYSGNSPSSIGNTYSSQERQRNYSGNSPSYKQQSNYANFESIQSAYTGPAPQEAPIYAKPNLRGSDMYNRPSSSPDQFQRHGQASPSNQYSPSSPDQYQRHDQPSPQNQYYSGEKTRHLSGGSGGFSPRYEDGSRPVPGPQVPNSQQGSSKEAEVDALTSLLMENMTSSSDPDFYGICCRCNCKVIGETNGCTAQDQVYHVSCFTCMECGTMLTGKQFYSMDTKPYCEACYINTLERCSVCSKPVTDRLLRATGKPYHPDCFVCVVCGKSLDGIPFTVDATSQIHCIEDFHKKFAPRCCVCHLPIMPKKGQEETVRVVAMDKSFHVECYRCEDCGTQLSSDAEGRGCYPLDEHILCKNCNARRIQAMTTKMTTEL